MHTVRSSPEAAQSKSSSISLLARDALHHLTLSDRVGQLIISPINWVRLDARSAQILRRLRPGGLIIFSENYRAQAQLKQLIAASQGVIRRDASHIPNAIVAIDQEGGSVKRIKDLPPTLSAPQLGQINRVRVSMRQGVQTGHSLRRLGINMNLAPVADLSGRALGAMKERSFGSRPEVVAKHVTAFMMGLQNEGVAASVKHYPGLGSASVNSDVGRVVINRSLSQMQRDFKPFQAAIDAGVDSVMVSHAVYSAFDRGRPASASPVIYRMLRKQHNFHGVVITDSLHAAGYRKLVSGGVGRGCVQAIRAGADVALLTGSLKDALVCRQQLILSVKNGQLSDERINESVLRVLRLKIKLGLVPQRRGHAAA